MDPVRKILAVCVPLLVALAMFTFQPPVFAAPTANLLSGHNPSFEHGVADWLLYHPGSTTTWKIVNDSAKPRCGQKALRFKFTDTNTGNAASAYVPMTPSTQYRIVVWLKITGSQNRVRLNVYERDPNDPSIEKGEILLQNIPATAGEWKHFAGTFTSMETPGEGRLTVSHQSGPGRVFIDCAAIRPLS